MNAELGDEHETLLMSLKVTPVDCYSTSCCSWRRIIAESMNQDGPEKFVTLESTVADQPVSIFDMDALSWLLFTASGIQF